MLQGAYTYTVWTIADSNKCHHYQISRLPGNLLGDVVKTPGSLEVLNTGTHFSGNTMCVANTEFHTVQALSNTQSCITLVVKFKASKSQNTRILTSTGEVESALPEVSLPMSTSLKSSILQCCQNASK
jgi:hypothetical protein